MSKFYRPDNQYFENLTLKKVYANHPLAVHKRYFFIPISKKLFSWPEPQIIDGQLNKFLDILLDLLVDIRYLMLDS